LKIADGYCQCGCGKETKSWNKTCKQRGRIKGQKRKYIIGHAIRGMNNPSWKGGRKVDKDGYILISSPNHPFKDSHGYVPEHVLICERVLGKYLPVCAVVHHTNKNHADNFSPFNLVICQNNTYHLYLHKRQRAYEACGHADWLRCRYCKKYDDPQNMVCRSYNNHAYADHKSCDNDYQRLRKLKKQGGKI
jgi:hypothetical protein